MCTKRNGGKMTSNEIRANIRYHENCIDSYYREKRNLEGQLDDLEALRDKFSSLQNRFAAKQDARNRSIARFSALKIHNSIFTTYLSGMLDLITGSSFNNAYEGLNEAKERIRNQMQNVLQRIDDCEDNIAYHIRRKSECESQLQVVLRQEEEAALAALEAQESDVH